MLSAFLFALSAIAPILLYMLIGFFLGHFYIKDDAFWKKLNGLIFRAFLSVLLFINIYDVNDFGIINWKGLLLILSVIAASIGVGGIASLFVKDRRQKGVIWQTTYRSNYAVVGIPLASSVGGNTAVAFASLVSAVTIPVYNTFSVFLLSFYSHDKEHKGKLGKTLFAVAQNPLILGTVAGIVALGIRALLPTDAAGLPVFSLRYDLAPVYTVLSAMAKASSPLALIVLGARFDLGALKRSIGMLSFGTVLRIVASPIVSVGLGMAASALGLVSLGAAEYATLLAIGGTPVAVSSAVMVSELGGDEALASALVASTSLFSLFTMTVLITFMRTLGLV